MVNPILIDDLKGEWLEIKNLGSEVIDLKGLTITSGSESHSIFASLSVEPQKTVVLCRNSDFSTNGGVSCAYQYDKIYLSNTQDNIVVSFEGQILNEIRYSSADMDVFGFVVANISPESEEQNQNNQALPTENKEEKNDSKIPEAASNYNVLPTAIISEALPNPSGTDGPDNEFIELFNPSEVSVDLSGWCLKEGGGREYCFEEGPLINPGEYFVLSRRIFGFALRNTQASLFLNQNDRIFSSLLFNGDAPAGLSYNTCTEPAFQWSSPTPGSANTCVLEKTESASENIVSAEQTLVHNVSSTGQMPPVITTVKDFAHTKNGTLVNIHGVAVSPFGVPLAKSFYLELDSGGILIKTSFEAGIEKGDVLWGTGLFKKNKDREFIYISSPSALINKGFREINYHEIKGDFSTESCNKKIGTAVQFSGTLGKKVFRSLYFKLKNNQTLRAHVPDGVDFDTKEIFLNQDYLIRGVLDKNSSGIRVLVSEIIDKNTTATTPDSDNIKQPTGNKPPGQEEASVPAASKSGDKGETKTKSDPKSRQSLLKSEAQSGHESITLFSRQYEKTGSQKILNLSPKEILQRVVVFLFSVI